MARQRRLIVILQRRLERSVALAQPDGVGRLRFNFVEMMAMEISEYAVLITRLAASSFLSVSFIALSRPCRLRERLRRVEEPMGWGGFTPSAGRNSHHYP
jgi:hypothetical protein